VANIAVKNSAGDTKYMKTSGAGTDEDPHIPEHTLSGTVTLGAGTAGIGKLTANSGVDIGDVDLTSLPAGNLGQQAMAASLSTVPASDITDATYIGDIKFGESLPAGSAAIGKLAANSGVDIGDVDILSIAAGENVIGLVGASDIVVTVTPTLDTNAYASGDLLFDSTAVAAAVRANGYCAILQSVTIIDKADQKVAFTLLVADTETDFGTLNSAPDPDDTEAATVIGWVPIAVADYVDLGGAAVACIKNIGLVCKAGAATTSLYIAAINGTGTPTYAASDLVFKLGFMRS